MSKVSHQYKVAIIGQSDVVSGFRALGVDTFPAYSSDEALSQLKNIKQLTSETGSPAYAVVCIIEDLMIGMDEKEYSRVMSGSFRRNEDLTEGDKEAVVDAVTKGREVGEAGSNSYLPAVVILPGTGGSQGFAEARLRKLSEKAIGAAII